MDDERKLMKDKDFLNKIIGQNIMRERLIRNMSREELAEIIGLSVAHLGLIEIGKRGLVAHTFYKLWCTFDIPIEYFFRISPTNHLEEFFAGGKILADNRKKIMSLLTNLSEFELHFFVDSIKAFNSMKINIEKKSK